MGSNPRQLIIVRHAKHEEGALTEEGLEAAGDVAGRIAETLTELPGGPPTVRVWTADSDEAANTAKVVADRLRADEPLRTVPGPDIWSPLGGKNASCLLGEWTSTLASRETIGDGELLAVVMHDPHAAWLVRTLTGRDVVLPHAGAAWLVPDAGPHALQLLLDPSARRPYAWRVWSIVEPSDRDLHESVVAKVELKYKTAGALSAFLTALFAVLAKALSDRAGAPALERGLWWAALVLVGIGAVLQFAALVEYDRLLMPARFWGAGEPDPRDPLDPRPDAGTRRPPASDTRVVIEGAQRVWGRLVLVSAGLTALAFVAGACALARPETARDLLAPVVPAAIVACAVAWWWLRRARPRLGTSD